jgi:hypothetical protein
LIDLSPYASAHLDYWRWYSNDTAGAPDDVWRVDASGDSGASWAALEDVAMSNRAWMPVDVDLGDLIVLSEEVRLRFTASDYGAESVVEAAVDDITVTACPCSVDTVAPATVIITPNGGEEATENSSFEIRWNATDDYGIRTVLVLASYDGGAVYDDTVGVAGGLDSTFVWQVPSGEHPACRIRIEVTDRGYNMTWDESDSTFAIIADVAAIEPGGSGGAPERVELLGSQVNPFAGSTHICFGLPAAMHVRVSIFDVQGRLVTRLLDRPVEAGYHTVVWTGRSDSGRPASPGTYFIHLEAEGRRKTAKTVRAR